MNSVWLKKVKHWSKEITTTLIMIFIIANAISFFRSPDLADTHLPAFNTILTNNELYDTTTLKGKPLLIHFWATWCPVCKLEAGNIQTLSEHFNVITIAVKSGSDEKINAYLKKHDLDFNVINDEDGYLANQFSVPAFPTTFIYDKNAQVKFSEVGYTSTLLLYLKMWWANL